MHDLPLVNPGGLWLAFVLAIVAAGWIDRMLVAFLQALFCRRIRPEQPLGEMMDAAVREHAPAMGHAFRAPTTRGEDRLLRRHRAGGNP
jgi:hypothetical protein